MLESFVYIILGLFVAALASPIAPGQYQPCPKSRPLENLRLEQVVGSWRLAYLFLGNAEDSVEEENTCVVVDILPTNTSDLELALFIDTARPTHVDRSTAQFPASLITPSEWQVHFPFYGDGFLHAKVLRSSDEHLVVTFCGTVPDEISDNEIPGLGGSSEDVLDWRTLFEASRRKKRYAPFKEEAHLWTAILVKHNNISALKFVEYAAVLMKHGFDVTQGELASFGQCPAVPNSQNNLL